MTDTVGFIQKLPTTLVKPSMPPWRKSSKPTCFCMLSHFAPQCLEPVPIRTGYARRAWRGIPVVTALNKADQLHDPEAAKAAATAISPKAVTISALNGLGIPDLLTRNPGRVIRDLHAHPGEASLPAGRLDLLVPRGWTDRAYRARARRCRHAGTHPGRLVAQFSDWQVSPDHHEPEAEEEEEEEI